MKYFIKDEKYLKDTAYRQVAIMQSFRYQPLFAFLYATGDAEEEFFAAAKKKIMWRWSA